MSRRPIIKLLGVALLLTASWASAGTASPHYGIDITVDYDAGTFAGIVRLDFQNDTGGDLNELFFRLYPNATGIYGNATIRVDDAVVDETAVPIATYVDDTVLYVPLPETLADGDWIVVTIAFEGSADSWLGGTPATASSYGLLTRSERAMTLTAFYPLLALHTEEGWVLDPVFEFGDALMSEASSYDVSLTIPEGLTPVTSGVLVDVVWADGSPTYRYTIEAARDFSAVLVDGYEYQEAVIDGVTLRTWFTPANGRASDVTLERASAALTLFGDLIGPAPYDEIDYVEIPTQHAAGIEFSGLILISSGYARDPEDVFYDIIVSHETAHQWFYAGVGNDITEDPWLDESLATYLSYVFLESTAPPAAASGTLDQWKRAYERAQASNPTLTIASPLYAFSQSSAYGGFVYSGGAVFLHEVRQAIGDEPFFAALATYYLENRGLIASPTDLICAFEASCDCQLTDLLVRFGLRP